MSKTSRVRVVVTMTPEEHERLLLAYQMSEARNLSAFCRSYLPVDDPSAGAAAKPLGEGSRHVGRDVRT